MVHITAAAMQRPHAPSPLLLWSCAPNSNTFACARACLLGREAASVMSHWPRMMRLDCHLCVGSSRTRGGRARRSYDESDSLISRSLIEYIRSKDFRKDFQSLSKSLTRLPSESTRTDAKIESNRVCYLGFGWGGGLVMGFSRSKRVSRRVPAAVHAASASSVQGSGTREL